MTTEERDIDQSRNGILAAILQKLSEKQHSDKIRANLEMCCDKLIRLIMKGAG